MIIPVILSGGSGTRLWPMSTPETPKQFLALSGDLTIFQQTLARVADAEQFAPPLIVANARHADLIDAQLEGGSATLLLEPCARNTAPAIALAAIEAGVQASEAVMLVMPSDHVIADGTAFHDAIARSLPLAQAGWMITFGITPTGPETGYGYIRMGDALADGVARVEQFIEKPHVDAAQAMLDAGGHAWNGGIFLFRADHYVASLADHAPEMLAAAQKAMDDAVRTDHHIYPDEAAFAASPSDSIDYAVMEKADRVACVPVSMGWSDLGSWDALYDLDDGNDCGNVLSGPVRLTDGSGNLIKSDGIRISAAGIEDLIIVASGNEVMILPRGQSQRVKGFSG